MRPVHSIFVASALALCACAGTPDVYQAVESANAQHYTDALNAAIRDREEGRITEAQMTARIRSAGETLVAADLSSARDQEAANASGTTQQTASAPPPRPENDDENGCLLISCPKSQSESAAKTAAPAPPNQAPATANAPPTDASKPPAADATDSCLIIRC